MTDPVAEQPKTARRIGLIVALALLAATLALATGLIVADFMGRSQTPVSANPSAARITADLVDVTVSPQWQALAPDTTLTRIGIGSCLHQDQPQPIWEGVIASKPELFLMVGDNVYGDIRRGDPNQLGRAYQRQGKQPELMAARKAFPFLATWDDHDYGLNDGGVGYKFQPQAAHFFRQFWNVPDANPTDGGIYYSRIYGPVGKRVQIIMLDTRSFRSPLQRKSRDFKHWGKYEPDRSAGKTILGGTQWAWLESELNKDAEVRLIVSSIQVLANGHGFERWGNLPAEGERLRRVLAKTGAKGVIFVSGDRHSGALFREQAAGNATPTQPALVELTASSLNRSFGPSRDTRLPPLVSEIFHQENFGLIDIDWDGRTVVISLKGMIGENLANQRFSFSDIGILD